MQGSGLAPVCPSHNLEGCRMALGFGVVLVGNWDLELEKPSVGSGKAGYFSLTIFYLKGFFSFTLIYTCKCTEKD